MLRGRGRAGIFRVLRNSREIDSARKLLYKVYVEELSWKFMPNNPSGIHVQQLASGEKMLCDHFDDEAVWIGTFKGQELAGVSRILTRENKFGKLDVELYESSKKPSTLFRLKEPCIEIQRIGSLKQRRRKHKFLAGILFFNLGFAKTRRSNVLVNSSLKYIRVSLENFGFECIDDKFFYGEENELPSSLYLLSFSKIDDAIKKLKDRVIQ
ncbi:uncharacterized protein LOC116306700 [Actinia tenebrosa]|uniref:Uncharacterized protein LOC116306700 n=1 Tax=Actinia tenebrosa TaxID=6105 RepID=A0A6P8J3Q4_ACTTE|nr:uncharacterized protein LOC116306700 [Actinia tenebrosa]